MPYIRLVFAGPYKKDSRKGKEQVRAAVDQAVAEVRICFWHGAPPAGS